MWRKESNLADIPPTSFRRTVVRFDEKVVPKTKEAKGSAAMALVKKIAAILSDCGTEQFNERIDKLNNLYQIWAKGGEAIVMKVLGTNRVQMMDGTGTLMESVLFFNL